jgi:hypothetical protein
MANLNHCKSVKVKFVRYVLYQEGKRSTGCNIFTATKKAPGTHYTEGQLDTRASLYIAANKKKFPPLKESTPQSSSLSPVIAFLLGIHIGREIMYRDEAMKCTITNLSFLLA